MRGALLFIMCMLCILYSFYLLESLFTRNSLISYTVVSLYAIWSG